MEISKEDVKSVEEQIEWAKNEIKLYEKFIKMLEKIKKTE